MSSDMKDTKGSMPVDEKDEKDDRIVKDVPSIPRHPLDRSFLFPSSGGSPDLEQLKSHLLREGRLEKKDAIDLIRAAKACFAQEPNLLQLTDPITGLCHL